MADHMSIIKGDKEFLSGSQTIEVGETTPGETRARRNKKFPDLISQPDENTKTLYDVYQLKIGRIRILTSIKQHSSSTLYRKNKNSDKQFLGIRAVNPDKTRGPYGWITYKEASNRAVNIGAGLVHLGIQKGDRIGIFSINRPEWILSDMGAVNHGMVPVALYATLGPNAIEFIINHADIKLVLCEAKNIDKMLQLTTTKGMTTIVSFDAPTEAVLNKLKESSIQFYTLAQLEQLGAAHPTPATPSGPEDICTILYTSGSTGNPKGVILTNTNMVSEVAGAYFSPAGLTSEDVHMSYLPLAHSFERAVACMVCYVEARIGFYSGVIPELFNDIHVLKPTFLVGAPRVWQKLHDKTWLTVNSGSWLTKTLFNWGFSSKQSALRQGSSTPIWDKILFSKTQEKLGGRVKFILSGSAPLDPKIAEFLIACFCCPVVQGYGLTENVGGAAVAYPEDQSIGHVGPPLACTEVKLVDVPEMNYFSTDKPFPRGEVCLRGYNVFTGYYKDPEKTAEDLKKDGWFHTGDIGRWNANGTLSIVDRKKNIFKLSQGEYVAAEYLEGIYVRSPLISQAFVYGDSLNSFLVGVVVPDFEVVEKMFGEKYPHMNAKDQKGLAASKELYKEIMDSFDACAKEANLQGFEKLKHIFVEAEAFTEENGLLTPSFKPRRPQLKDRYQATIGTLYDEFKRDHPEIV
ncbi:fatty acyl-CoA synthetase [Heterostelium album PN500]|uniref:Long-chain-fatty-acid--CoA ligase n=1 Tax=Heterostelium pallidum (strain ATCC 26659 / Pp 5 / PN500) TaxID=670386 RepID=D3B2D6_HETP5|nr:fatty acyl-CoA synthetase [Heterostelium album PN500]EFA84511.1 fatty acyl-CoA synthetase [Heterostelium album PN500]|eukprot:XP_020436624.1 fatty acyl-CoA synthetase [Heterostelium album PN500]